MRVILTGQVGMDKKEYAKLATQAARDHGEHVSLYNVGDMMYDEVAGVKPGRILDLPLSRLQTLRRAVVRDIITDSTDREHVIVNTHATFRWRHGLFSAFDFDQVKLLKPDIFVCLLDNIEVVYHRLHRDHTIDATLKDLMVWREEEIMATQLLAQSLDYGDRFFVFARGRYHHTAETASRLICNPGMRKVYPSFPMSHVTGLPDVLAEIDQFRAELAKHFIAFDPGEVDEKLMLDAAIAADERGEDFLPREITDSYGNTETIGVPVKQILDIAGDIDGQIYARDFLLIDQSDMIVSLIPELPGGVPGLSSGVERELHHAFEHGKEVYVVWKPAKKPSPFITETATKVFGSIEEAMGYFEEMGICHRVSLFEQ